MNANTIMRHAEDIYSYITNSKIHWTAVVDIQIIVQLRFVRDTNDWHNRRFGRKLILYIPQVISHVHFVVNMATFLLMDLHFLTIEVLLKWVMGHQKICIFEDITKV